MIKYFSIAVAVAILVVSAHGSRRGLMMNQTGNVVIPLDTNDLLNVTGPAVWYSTRYNPLGYRQGQEVLTNVNLAASGSVYDAVKFGLVAPRLETNLLWNSSAAWQLDAGWKWRAPNFTNQLGDVTMFVVATDFPGSSGRIIAKYLSGAFGSGLTASHQAGSGWRLAIAEGSGTYVNGPTNATVMLRRSGSTRTVWVNGTNWLSGTTSATTTDKGVLHIGTDVDDVPWFTGYVGEIAIWTNALPLADCTNIMRFLAVTNFATNPDMP